MGIDDILSDADRAEREYLAEESRRAEEEATRAVRRIEAALSCAREELDHRGPDLDRLGRVLSALMFNRPKVNDAHRKRLARAAAYILAEASLRVDPSYRGPRYLGPMPEPLSEQVIRRPAAPIEADPYGGL